LLVVGVAFGVAYYSVFAASVAYASAMCDPRKLSPAGQHFTSAIGAYR